MLFYNAVLTSDVFTAPGVFDTTIPNVGNIRLLNSKTLPNNITVLLGIDCLIRKYGTCCWIFDEDLRCIAVSCACDQSRCWMYRKICSPKHANVV